MADERQHELKDERAEMHRQLLQTLFMQAQTHIAVLRGPDFVIEMANPPLCRAWGKSEAELRGHRLLDVVPDLAANPFLQKMRDVHLTGTPCVEREVLSHARPERGIPQRYFNLECFPFTGKDGRAEGVFIIASDVTDSVVARERADGMRQNAESENRNKDEFLAILGHELRNPLSPIVTALQLMKLQPETADRARTVIERQVGNLTRLIDDLLDVSRIGRGKISLKLERIELSEVVAKAIELSHPLLEQRAHQLVVDVPNHGIIVNADATRLAQVISNLLNNAAKYTPKGGAVMVTAAAEGRDAVLSVRDTGIGIPPTHLASIFELFVQGADRSHGGLGIGLTIVRDLVQMHGGTVTARSEGEGQGSEFLVRLPLA